MIARPIHRPAPIPFEAPSPQAGLNQPRAISWAAASGPAVYALLGTQAKPFAAPHLSSVKKPMPPAPQPGHASGQVSETSKRVAPIKAPYNKTPSLTEPSARYIGHGALSVRSSVTGRHYRFQGHGDSQKVDKNDLMLLKRIADLEIR